MVTLAGWFFSDALPETNSKFAPENGWLVLFGARPVLTGYVV